MNGSPRLLDGGQGTSWAVEDLVFKPCADSQVHDWLAGALADVTPDGFRIAMPVRTRDGAWAGTGWSATRWLEGSSPDYSAVSTWQEILTAGRAFHRSVAHLKRPDVLDARKDWWALADRAAWGERVMRFRPEYADMARRLQGALKPLGRPQIVHET